MNDREMIEKIKEALGTEEEGEPLLEVARNCRMAEQKLATFLVSMNSGKPIDEAVERLIGQ